MKATNTIITALGALLITALASCNTPTPENNALNKGHDEFTHVEITFTEGTPAGGTFSDPIYGKDFTKGSHTTKFVWGEAKDGTMLPKQSIELKRGTWYEMDIRLFNRAGADITSDITTNEAQRAIHQFFFQLFEGEKTTKQLNDFLDYRYGDLQADGSLLMPPIGLRGYVKISSTDLNEVYMRVFLLHITNNQSKINPKTGKPYPFNGPQGKILGVRDDDFRIPVKLI